MGDSLGTLKSKNDSWTFGDWSLFGIKDEKGSGLVDWLGNIGNVGTVTKNGVETAQRQDFVGTSIANQSELLTTNGGLDYANNKIQEYNKTLKEEDTKKSLLTDEDVKAAEADQKVNGGLGTALSVGKFGLDIYALTEAAKVQAFAEKDANRKFALNEEKAKAYFADVGYEKANAGLGTLASTRKGRVARDMSNAFQ